MGWWKVEGTNKVIGDGPLDVLERAIAEVILQYQEAHGRKPAKDEWESLLSAVLGSATSEERITDDGEVASVHLELK